MSAEDIKTHYEGILSILNSNEDDDISKPDLDKIIKHADGLVNIESES